MRCQCGSAALRRSGALVERHFPKSLASLRAAPFVMALAVGLCPALASAQAKKAPAKPKAAPVVVLRGTVHADGATHADGAVVVKDGKIAAVGAWPIAMPKSAKVIAIKGAHISAGLIDAASTAGVQNKNAWSEQAAEVVAHLKTSDAIDLTSNDFKRLVKRGVTTVYVGGGPSSVIGGQGVVVKTAGKRRVVRDGGEIHATLGPETWGRGGFNRRPSSWGNGVTHMTRRPTTFIGNVWVFREAFHTAPTKAKDPSAAILREVLSGQRGMRILARKRNAIEAALRLAREFKLQFVLEEGTEVYYLLDMIKAAKVPVIFGPTSIQPRGRYRAMMGEANDPCLTTPRRLAAKGIPFCLTANDLSGEDDLWGQALMAVRYGLKPEAALEAVTSSAAKILGKDVEARTGRLAVGLDADVVVWSGAPLSATTKALAVLIDGDVVAGSLDGKTNSKAGPGSSPKAPGGKRKPRRQFNDPSGDAVREDVK